MIFDANIVAVLLGAIGSGGIAWGAARVGARVAHDDIRELKETLREHVAEDHENALASERRLARLEALVTEVHKVVVPRRRMSDKHES